MPEQNAVEEQILKYWSDNSIMQKVRAKNRDGKYFYFLDGPPYASGELHPGQIWVKTVKDIFLRYRRFNGYHVHDRAGYDVHGLPIERRVEKSLNINSKKEIESTIGVEKFVTTCKSFVQELIPRMSADFIRFGMSMDFDKPYLPYTKEFISNAWGVLKIANDKKLLYHGLKPMLYCTHCETVLAQGTLEVEYANETDPSIFVAFKLQQKPSKTGIKFDDKTYLLIWTTTPWTLPANVAVAVNPKETYVKAKIQDRSFIISKPRLEAVMANLEESAIIEGEYSGSQLEGLLYLSPLEEKMPKQKELRKYHRVVMAEGLVSSTEGSGLVHIAPGHGVEDYKVGLAQKLPIFSPVDMHAKYTSDAGEFQSLSVPNEANDKVLQYLEITGALLDKGKVTHSYPHCWRCDTKLIQIATKQWFLNIQKIKNKTIAQNRKVSWHPKEAQAWQEEVLINSPDWCISRQRFWGIPLPIWECDKCHSTKVIGSFEELVNSASDKERAKSLTDLHRPYIDSILLKCEGCNGMMKRAPDVLDVWFDSGVAFRASVSKEEFEKLYPADFILEGKDQLRGWFSTLLKSSTMVYGKTPFKNVVIDGMLLAEDGREMHKKLGNYISLPDLLKITSADAYRLWCSGHTQWLDLQFKKDEIREADKVLNTLSNVFKLIEEYASSIDYVPDSIKKPKINETSALEDVWIVSRFNTVSLKVTDALENYTVQDANQALCNFIMNDLSRFYLKLAKKRILESKKGEAKKTIDLVNYLLYNLITLLAPFTPFSSENLYLNNYRKYEGSQESIFLTPWPKSSKKLINETVEKEFESAMDAVTAILNSREKSKVKLRWPISKATIEVNNDALQTSLQKFSAIIEDYTNTRHLEFKRAHSAVEIKPAFAKLGPDFKDKSSSVAAALKTADAKKLMADIEKSGVHMLRTEKGTVEIKPEHFTSVEIMSNENAAPFNGGLAYIDPKLDNALMEEAMVREVERKIQMVRKEMGLKKPDKVQILYGGSPALVKMIESDKKQILVNVNATHMKEQSSPQSKEFEIEGEKLHLLIERV